MNRLYPDPEELQQDTQEDVRYMEEGQKDLESKINIKLGEFLITSDSLNLILSKKVKSKKDPKKVSYKIIGFFPDFESLTGDLVDTAVRSIEARSLQELIKGVSELKKTLLRQTVVS